MKIIILIVFLLILVGCSSLKIVQPVKRTNLNLATDLELAKASDYAYVGVSAFSNYSETVEFNNETTGTKAYIAIDHVRKIAILVYRGTEKQKKDIKTDIKFLKKSYKGIRVHRGFLKAYQSLEIDINESLSWLPQDYKIYATGHSLGGALACLAGLFNDRKIDKITTFGQPRVGNKDVANRLTKMNYTRYVNHADAVARAPRINYFHGKDLIYISKGGDYYINPLSTYMFRDRLGNIKHRFSDHAITKYIKRISDILEKTTESNE